MQWAWETLLDAPIPEPETAARTAEEVAPYCGRYETVANLFDVTSSGDGLSLLVVDRPECSRSSASSSSRSRRSRSCFRAGPADRIVCTTPPYAGSSGFFLRDDAGRVTAMNAFGRHAVRTG